MKTNAMCHRTVRMCGSPGQRLGFAGYLLRIAGKRKRCKTVEPWRAGC